MSFIFPVSTITYNYIQINKAYVFCTVLKIWGLPTDYNCKLPPWFIIQNSWDWFKKIIPHKFSHNKNVSANISGVLENFKLILLVVKYCVTKILTIWNIFLFKFTASSLYCLRQPAENHKSDGQAPNYTLFPRILCERDITLALSYHQGSAKI